MERRAVSPRPRRQPGERAFHLAWAVQGPLRATTPFQTIAVSFWLLDRGGNFTEIGVALAVPVLTAFLGVLLGGWLTDRAEPLRLLARLDVTLLGIALALLGAAQLPQHAEVAVVALSALYAFVNGAGGPAQRSLTPRLLSEDRYSHGNAVFSAVTNTAMIAGPLLGGLLYSAGGLAWCVALNAAALALAGAVMTALGRRVTPAQHDTDDEPREGFITAVSAAARFVVAARWLLLLLAMDAVLDMVTAGLFQTGFRALSQPQGGADVFGLLMAAYGIGAIAGAWCAGRGRDRTRQAFAIVMVSNILQAPLIAVLPLLPLVMLLPALVTIGLLNGFANVVYMTFVFAHIPARMAGRVSSFLLAASLSLQPLGIVMFGVVIDTAGTTALFMTCGTVLLVVSIAAFVVWRALGLGDRLDPRDGHGATDDGDSGL